VGFFAAVFLACLAQAQTVVGVYPSYPASGPLEGKTAQQQAQYLRGLGVNLAGGRFEDGEVPAALRAAGIRTFGLAALFQGEEHWKKHPDSRPVMADGRPLFKDRWYAGVCPNHPIVRREKLEEIEQMLKSGRYDVINLDFIRYPVHWEVPEPKIPDTCYCRHCLEKFQRDTGLRIPSEPADVPSAARWIRENQRENWRRWRADQITAFCAEVKRLRDRIRPETRIALAAVPWQTHDYENAVYRVVGQDFASLAKVIDVFNPMSYHVLNGRPVAWIGEVNEYMVKSTGREVWPFVIADETKPLTREQWQETFDQALSGGANGLIGFPFPTLAASEGFVVFRQLFGQP
jgi:hypothetical protein